MPLLERFPANSDQVALESKREPGGFISPSVGPS